MERTMIQTFATMTVFLFLGFQPVLSQVDITRKGCNETKFCLEKPANCIPSINGTGCLFGSIQPLENNAPNGFKMAFELSGMSSGYIALGLTKNAAQGNTTLFVCAHNSSSNGTFFRMMNLNNGSMDILAQGATGFAYSVFNETMNCKFTVSNLNASAATTNTRAAEDTTYVVVIGSGPVNGDLLGPFTMAASSGSAVNLANFLSTNATNTTATPSGANQPLYSNVLVLLGFVTISVLKFA